METNPLYPKANSGHNDSFEIGIEFQDFVCIELAKAGILLQNINSKRYQYNIGENLQGFEIKYDSRFLETKQLAFEIEEKTKAENAYFVTSGIYRKDNSWLYIQGNYEVVYVFQKTLLQLLHQSGRYKEYLARPTSRVFFLPLKDADKYCAKKIIFKNNAH